MVNRQFYVYKLSSKILHHNKYRLDMNFKQAKENGEVVAVADSQMLRSIRSLQGRYIDTDDIERLFNKRNELKKLNSSIANSVVIKEINSKINKMMFVPEYVSVIIDSVSHYKKIIKNGIYINKEKYVRFSCSASQARVNTIIMVLESISENLYNILNNGRKDIPLNPSKFNAYFGLSSSATLTVSNPRVCVVPDCNKIRSTYVNWVTERDGYLEDDLIEQKFVDFEFNYFDGQGIIFPHMAKRWSEELGMDYVPSEWCIRNAFMKGMVCVFDMIDFCRLKNNGNYMIKDLYGRIVDIRNFDMIVSESQFKMHNCYDSYEEYEHKFIENGLSWGISKFSPKIEKDVLKLNYQSIQTLIMDNQDIENICQPTIDWISKVTNKDVMHSILFSLGENISQESIEFFLQSSDNYYTKSLVYNNALINDKYIQDKIYNNVVNKIKRACLGEIFIEGNYQCMVSDPYAMAEHICGLEPIGLLKDKEHYSKYWNDKGIIEVDAMRSPLTYRSEHNILNFKKNDEIEYWYKHLDSGIIYNVHGDDIIRHADSDFDHDICATSNNSTLLKCVDRKALPVSYQKKMTDKSEITFQSLCEADLMAFGSDIGKITNKSTSMYSMLPLYPIDSPERNEIENRLIMTRVAQGSSIDKAKGIKVKDFPKHWSTYQKINDDDNADIKAKKELFNNIVIEKKPYFFIYLYNHVKKEYNKYISSYQEYIGDKFNCSVFDLISKKRISADERKDIINYKKYFPVINTDCEMNRLCRYIESFEFSLKKNIKGDLDENCWKQYISSEDVDKKLYNNLIVEVKKYFLESEERILMSNFDKNEKKLDNESKNYGILDEFRDKCSFLCSDEDKLVNHLVKVFYTEIKSKNKDILWSCYGKQMSNNVRGKISSYFIPERDKNGNIDYLGTKFTKKEVFLNE